MKEMNLDAYRFSISWSRILPKGKLCGGINQEGIEYYNKLIDELLAKGLQPFVTLFHWDVPQALEDEYGGFLNHQIINDFQDYAELCFKKFGDRVKHWITLNEPLEFISGGYATGTTAPGRCSECACGDSGIEPYLVSHNLLLAHAKAVHVYREHYQFIRLQYCCQGLRILVIYITCHSKYSTQASQKGVIGITLDSRWFLPYSNCNCLDQEAVQRALDFEFMGPLTSGNYPQSMRSLVGSRLPHFSDQEAKLMSGSFDFLGLNYYTTKYAANKIKPLCSKPDLLTDSRVEFKIGHRNGTPIGPVAGSPWLYVYPKGIKDLLLYIKREYKNPLIYITENGVDEINDPTLSLEESLIDTWRIDYHYRHLFYVHSAIREGVNIKGYFAWSLLDDFEWSSGYTVRFGLHFVDYNNNLKRHQKLSAKWFKEFLRKHRPIWTSDSNK
ncbi:hypothetical protein CR513_60042, partial [Mucuna pruriens]